MPRCEPRARPLAEVDARPLAWGAVRRQLACVDLAWFTSLRPDGHPHTRPVRPVWLGDRCFLVAGVRTVQSRNVVRDARCSLATAAPDLDITVEGRVVEATDEPVLAAVAEAYGRIHGWALTPDVGMLDGSAGAPVPGPPPPYRVFEVVVDRAFAFGTNRALGSRSTRFEF